MENLLNELDALTWGQYHYDTVPEQCIVREKETALISFAFSKVQYEGDDMSVIKCNCSYSESDGWEIENHQIDRGSFHIDIIKALYEMILDYLTIKHPDGHE